MEFRQNDKENFRESFGRTAAWKWKRSDNSLLSSLDSCLDDVHLLKTKSKTKIDQSHRKVEENYRNLSEIQKQATSKCQQMIAIDTNQIANSFYCRSYKDKLNRITDDFLRSSTRRGEKFKAIESEIHRLTVAEEQQRSMRQENYGDLIDQFEQQITIIEAEIKQLRKGSQRVLDQIDQIVFETNASMSEKVKSQGKNRLAQHGIVVNVVSECMQKLRNCQG